MRWAAVLALVSLFAACENSQHAVAIDFDAVLNRSDVTCESSDTAMTDLRFYVSEVEIRDAQGDWQSLRLPPDGRWQSANVALIDLENGAEACRNGTPETNHALSGTMHAEPGLGLRFVIGVPFELNHANPLTATPPLDDAAMHWHWRSGYKFFRAGTRSESGSFWVHLGSTGCEGTVQNITACRAPNRVEVELPDFDPGSDTVLVDLATLPSAEGDFDCSSSPAETACAGAFSVFGLSFGGSKAGTQTIFRAAP